MTVMSDVYIVLLWLCCLGVLCLKCPIKVIENITRSQEVKLDLRKAMAYNLSIETKQTNVPRFRPSQVVALVARQSIFLSCLAAAPPYSNPGPSNLQSTSLPLCYLTTFLEPAGFDPTTFRSWGERAANTAIITLAK